MKINEIPVEISLQVTHNGNLVFRSQGKWLYPLFDLGEFLAKQNYLIEELTLVDKIAGKAAAFLIVRMGFTHIHLKLISKGALEVFSRFGRKVTFDQIVENIQCKTEQLVSSNDDPELVWQMLRRRAGRVSGLELKVEGVKFELEGKEILKEVNLQVNKGDHIVIKGPNGAGKTTLLKAILGLVPLSGGRISVGGLWVGSPEWRRKRNFVGYVDQNQVKNNFPVLAFEVVEIGLATQRFSKAETRHRVEIAMRRTGCFHLAQAPYFSLSGGEKQRVALARCLCQEASLLLFDEPTSFLDQESKEDLKNLLLELWSNEAPSIIIVSHDHQWVDPFNWPAYEMNNGMLTKI